MTKVVGQQQRDEFILDPREAWVRGQRLDAMLRRALPPASKFVRRMSHQQMNDMDDERALVMARRINSP